MRHAAADRATLLRICVFLQVGIPAWLAAPAAAQVATRLDIVEAEAHGAASSRDLLILRSATHSGDSETARMAVRALGRIERPSALPDILLQLRHSLPEVRAEAANAAAQSAQGFKTGKNAPVGVSVQSVQAALIARLSVEDDPSVRAALCEAVARLPYKSAGDADRAETTILDVSSTHGANVTDRLGVARGLEALVRLHSELRPPSSRAIAWLRTSIVATTARPGMEITHDERIRRLALEALIGAHAVDDDLIAAAIHDPDAQVRRLAMLAVGLSEVGMGSVPNGLLDITPIVRLEALRAVRTRGANWACEAALKSLTDSDMTVALLALDQLSTCGRVPEAVAALERAVADRSEADAGRGWHRTAHALVALAGAAPERIGDVLNLSATSGTWQLRMYAARAAAIAGDQTRLETLAADSDERVANAALAGLQRPLRPVPSAKEEVVPEPSAADLRRLASPRAIVTIRDVGRIEFALFTNEAPSTVLRFARLAESGYYNGLTFDRVAPNVVAQAGRRPDGNTSYPNPEVGMWPHVRGAVGISTPDTGDAQFFIDLVDNPRFDHRYTVFAQVLNGAELVDSILEGDVIESVVIVP